MPLGYIAQNTAGVYSLAETKAHTGVGLRFGHLFYRSIEEVGSREVGSRE